MNITVTEKQAKTIVQLIAAAGALRERTPMTVMAAVDIVIDMKEEDLAELRKRFRSIWCEMLLSHECNCPACRARRKIKGN